MNLKIIDSAVVDSSALMSILLYEKAATFFEEALFNTQHLFMSAPTRAELHLAAMSSRGRLGAELMGNLINQFEIQIVDFSAGDLMDYQRAADQYHLKAIPPGLLNMGDIFSFVLAHQMDLPLFFQGSDFLETPVKNAMMILGYEMNHQNRGVPTPLSF